jgi:hypothetical protein
MIPCGAIVTHTDYAAFAARVGVSLPSQQFMCIAPLLKYPALAFDEKCPHQRRKHLKWISIQSAGEFLRRGLSQGRVIATTLPLGHGSHAKNI